MNYKNILLSFFIVISLSVFSNLRAQGRDASTYYYDKVDDDKEISDLRNILKTDIYSIIEGDLPLIYEHRFTNRLGLETGGGVLLPFNSTILPIAVAADRSTSFKVDKPGISFMLAPRLYNALEPRTYWSAMYRLRGYENLTVNEFGVGKGFMFFLSDKFLADGTAYATVLWQKKRGPNGSYRFYDGPLWEKDNGLVFTLTFAIKFGFAIN